MPEIHRVVPVLEGVTDAYAAASGDHNPIHVDESVARAAGLPGRILHGLWTAAQVAQAATREAPDGAVIGDGSQQRYGLAAMEVSFRGMGVIGPDLTVSGRLGELIGEDDFAQTARALGASLEARVDAVQAGTRLIRGGRAALRET